MLLAACGATPSNTLPHEAVCDHGTTLVCAYRLGKPYKCSCKDKDAVREIFERGKTG